MMVEELKFKRSVRESRNTCQHIQCLQREIDIKAGATILNPNSLYKTMPLCILAIHRLGDANHLQS